MYAVLTVIITLAIALVITRTASVALTMTGMAADTARFQARSAFTGAGFTTSESELIVRHPVRRKIIGLLMVLGNAGLVTVVSSLMMTLMQQPEGGSNPWRFAWLVLGIFIIFGAAQSQVVDKWMCHRIQGALAKHPDLKNEAQDIAHLLNLGPDFGITEVEITKNHWMNGQSLSELDFPQLQITALGVHPSVGAYEATLSPERIVKEGDRLVLYGALHNIKSKCGLHLEAPPE